MRNIYDIIAEQKTLIDVNMAHYDLKYTVDHFFINDYIQEGIGESLKNLAVKVIEFIRSLISKIGSLIKRMIDFLFGKKDRRSVEDLKNAKIKGSEKDDIDKKIEKDKETLDDLKKQKDELKDVNKKLNTDKEKQQEKQSTEGMYDKNIHKGKEPADVAKLSLLFKGSLRTANMVKYVGFDKKEAIMTQFLNTIYSTSERYLGGEAGGIPGDQFAKLLTNKLFKGAGSYAKNKDNISMEERILLELGESKEKVAIKVREIPINVPLSYKEADASHGGGVKNKGKGLAKFLKEAGDNAEKSLIKLEKKCEELQRGGENVDQVAFSHIQKAATLVSSFTNAITTNVFKAFNDFASLESQVLADYCAAYNVIFV